MCAGKERQHTARLPYVNSHKLRLLPVSAIYGGNASGKSNFVSALAFCANYICPGTRADVNTLFFPFLPDPDCREQPTRFCITLLADNDKIYKYSFLIDGKRVLDERLILCDGDASKDVLLFHRTEQEDALHGSLAKDVRMAFIRQGTQRNQLFLSNAISQQVKYEDLSAVYNWFRHNLFVVTPKTNIHPGKLHQVLDENLCAILSGLDTGILGFEETIISGEHVDKEMLSTIGQMLTQKPEQLIAFPTGNTYFRLVDGEVKLIQLDPVHGTKTGERIKFSYDDESDGTLRIIDLLPMFMRLTSAGSRMVFVIDEIDRSLHTLMAQALLRSYLLSCKPESRSQLLFTTHNVLLMDQDLFRRDEIWITERSQFGESQLLSFAEFKEVRNDKKLIRSYLQGRMGGIPNITFNGAFGDRFGALNERPEVSDEQ